MNSSSALLGMLRKEAYHILRDRRTLIVVSLLPILQVIIFGFAIRTDVDHVRIAIVDPTPDYATLELRSRFAATGVFKIVATVPTDREPRPDVSKRHGAGGGGVRAALRRGARTGNRGPGPDHHRRHRAEHRQRGAGVRLVRDSGLRTRAAVAAAPGADRSGDPHALQPHARQRQPVRPRTDGLRADHRLHADDGNLAHP